MTLIDRIEALARAKGWHADQSAHGPADRSWLLRSIAYDRVRLYPPDPGGPDWHDVSTADAALWLLLRVSGLPDVDASVLGARRTRTALDWSAADGYHRVPSGGRTHDRATLAQLARRLQSEAIVLGDRWQTDGVGLSTDRIPDGALERKGWARCSVCERSPEWWTSEHMGTGPMYCHDHRPRDGYGDQLAAAIAEDRHWEAPPDLVTMEDGRVIDPTPGRKHGDGYSPMLWRLIDKWLGREAEARESEKTIWPVGESALRSDLEAALAAALVRAGGDAAPRRRPLHERLAEALDAGRTWLALESGDVVSGQRTVGVVRPRRDSIARALWLARPEEATFEFPVHDEFTFDVRLYVIREPSLRAVVVQNLAVLRGSPEPPFEAAIREAATCAGETGSGAMSR